MIDDNASYLDEGTSNEKMSSKDEAHSMTTPKEVIRQTRTSIDWSRDLESIHQLTNTTRQIEEIRQKQKQDTQKTLRSLSRQLELAKTNASRPSSVPDEFEHSNTMVERDREKFQIAKNINELEQNVSSLDSQLARLKEEWSKIDQENIEDAFPVDQTILKLKICRSLGFDLIEDEAGNFSKAIIRSERTKDVRTLIIDRDHSRYFYANFLWDMCS